MIDSLASHCDKPALAFVFTASQQLHPTLSQQVIFWSSALLLGAVMLLLAYSLARYHLNESRELSTTARTKDRLSEVFWSLIPIALLLALLIPSILALSRSLSLSH